MGRPSKLEDAAVDAWLATNTGWAREGSGAIGRSFRFPDFSTTLAFVVRVGLVAEKRDHHPDIAFGWGKAHVSWSTHDAGGITELDLGLAEATSKLANT